MGFLNQAGASIGQAGGGAYASAPTAAYGSLGMGSLATGTAALADIFEGIGGSQQANYAAKVSQQNARAALAGGQIEEESSKLRYGALEARQEAGQAAAGVGVNSASALNVRRSTQEISDIDAALIHYNAAREAYGQETQAGLEKAAAGNILTKGIMGAGASLISGASSLSDKWLQYQLSGATAPTPGFS